MAEWLRVSPRTIETYVSEGQLRPIKVRRLNRFAVAEVTAFIVPWNQTGLPRHVNGTPILPSRPFELPSTPFEYDEELVED